MMFSTTAVGGTAELWSRKTRFMIIFVFCILSHSCIVSTTAAPTIGYHVCKATDATPLYAGNPYDCAQGLQSCVHSELKECESWCHTSQGCKFEYDCAAAFAANRPAECADGTEDPATSPGCRDVCDSKWSCVSSTDGESCENGWSSGVETDADVSGGSVLRGRLDTGCALMLCALWISV